MSKLIIGTGVASTLVLWTALADPINVPKMFVLCLCTAWILGASIASFFQEPREKLGLGEISIVIFIVGVVLAAVLTDERYTAFYGARSRNDGAFTYIALAVLSLAAMRFFGSKTLPFFRYSLTGLGIFLACYGILQTTGHDPFKWNLIYNPIMGTLGNPDFMSALLGVCAIATLWTLVFESSLWIRITGVVIILVELIIIRKSGSMQGLLIAGLGITALVVTLLWRWKSKAGLVSLGLAVMGLVQVMLGVLNKGPIAQHLHQGSIQSRIDYWNSAFSAFKAHPILGVGLDRFGESYAQYAPQKQIIQGQMTDNAHNVFLQLLATGGLVVVLPYLFLLIVIFVTAIKGISGLRGKDQFELIALFFIWFSLLLISVISIDNIGQAVWFWISGGILYGISRRNQLASEPIKVGKGKRQARSKTQERNDGSEYISPLISSGLVLVTFLLVLPAWRTSNAISDLQRNSAQLNRTAFIAQMTKVSTMWPSNPQNLIQLSDLSMRISDPDLALNLANQAIKKDPRSLNARLLGAVAQESKKNFALAIPYRVRLLQLDPWGTANMLQLVKDYIQVKDLAKAQEIAALINHNYPSSDNAKAAALLVKG